MFGGIRIQWGWRVLRHRRWISVQRWVSVVFTLALVFFWVTPVFADTPSFDTRRKFGLGDDITSSIVMGDVNGDGHLDLIVGNNGDPSAVYLNDGLGNFLVERQFETDISSRMSVVVADMDGDGDLDIVAGNGEISGIQNTIYLNDGAGNFNSSRSFGGSDDCTWSIAVGDMNGDSFLDIITGNGGECGGQQNVVFVNDGTGNFPTEWNFGTGTDDTYSVTVADIDGDGDLDIATGNSWQEQSAIYFNNGAGDFTTSRSFGAENVTTTSLAIADLDSDGDFDIVTGNVDDYYGPGLQNVVYLNDENGSFSVERNFGTGSDLTHDVVLGDMDGDGDLDIVVGNTDEATEYIAQNVIYLNDGTGNFSGSGLDFGTGNDDTDALAIGDVDGDGYLDIAVGNDYMQNAVYLNDGVGGFPLGRNFGTGGDPTKSVAVGDMDGDGDLDLIIGNAFGENQNMVYLYNGINDFPIGNPFGSGDDWTHSVVAGDMDSDGDLDIVTGNLYEQNVVYLNDGTGSVFIARDFGTGSDATYSVAVGDMDGDGDLDIITGNEYSQNAVYLNDGLGNFETGDNFGTGSDNTRSVAVGDIDGDSDLDIVVGNNYEPNRVYLNDGVGSFPIESTFGPAGYETQSVAVGDMDGDGDLDVVAGNGGNHGAPDLVYLNDGGGNFATSRDIGTGGESTWSVKVGDVDGDGDLDIVAGNDLQNVVHLNDGVGNFDSIRSFGTGSDETRSVAVGDLDGDGDLDLVAGNSSESMNLRQNVIYLNEIRQLYGLPNHGPLIKVTRPISTSNADFFSTPVLLDSPTIPITYTLFDPELDPVGRVAAFFSMDGGGQWLPAVATRETVTENLTTVARNYVGHDGLPLPIPGSDILDTVTVSATLVITELHEITDVDVWLYITHTYNSDLDVYLQSPSGTRVELFTDIGGSGDDFAYTTLSDQASTSIVSGTSPFAGTYRPEGQLADFNGEVSAGTWTLVITDDFPSLDYGTLLAWGVKLNASTATYVYTWDTFKSGLFGQSDHAVLRMVAYPQPAHSSITGTYFYTNSVPGPYQWPYASATTFPFRVRGTQVRVYSETVYADNTIANALVYRLPEGQTTGGFPLADGAGTPYRTDAYGYLKGRGAIAPGDRLVAMAPVHTEYSNVRLRFDGDDVVSMPGVPPVTQALTLEAWVRPEAAGGDGELIQRGGRSIYSGYALSLFQGNLRVELQDRGRGEKVTVDNPVPDGDGWFHVAVTWDAISQTVKLYVNGVLQSVTGTFVGPIGDPTEEFSVGSDFRGEINHVRLWDTARSQDEIQQQAFSVLDGDEAGMVGYWPFDEGTGDVVHDRAIDPHPGLVNGPQWTGEERYTVYHTSASPTLTGMAGYTVTHSGVQTLTVSADNPLVLFNLGVSLEWDARKDALYLAQLEYDLQRTSEILYDFSNGQAALGEVTLYHDREAWFTADVQVHATNALRPNADIGGVSTRVITELIATNPYSIATQPYTLTYGPGHVRLGATWNRFGESGGTLGEDWPRTLAHELGHYLLYQYDNYVGLDATGKLIPVASCDGSIMTNQYFEDYSELRGVADWDIDCSETLSARRSGRSDWETVERFYPWLHPDRVNAGPTGLPLAVTQIRESTTLTEPPTTLAVPIFYLTKDGAAHQAHASAQAVLYQDDVLIDLGHPSQDKVRAWGARPGDRLCVYEPGTLGCETVTVGDTYLDLETVTGWQPDVQLTPVNSQTIAMTVTVSGIGDGAGLYGRLYPRNALAVDPITLTVTGAGASDVYTGAFALPWPSDQGYVQLWVSGTLPLRETVTTYVLGGNPGPVELGFGAMSTGFGAMSTGFGVLSSGFGAMSTGFGAMSTGFGAMSTGFAPSASTDGQVVLYTDSEFAQGEFYSLYRATVLPDLPTWTTVVGEGYWLTVSREAPDLSDATLNFRYLGEQVPAGGESFLRLYYWDGVTWTALPTILHPDYNSAIGPVPGPGLYVLASSIEVPLEAPGWNLLAYPVLASAPVTQALLSINDHYTTVYGYDATDAVDPWKVYDKTVPEYVNQLHKLEFGKGYWISVTQAITLYLNGAGGLQAPMDVATSGYPPATYYGQVLSSPDFEPQPDETVTAWIGDTTCGQGQTLLVNGDVFYALDVVADSPSTGQGCGAPGRVVQFRIGSTAMQPTAVWDNRRVWELDLEQTHSSIGIIYLPLVLRSF